MIKPERLDKEQKAQLKELTEALNNSEFVTSRKQAYGTRTDVKLRYMVGGILFLILTITDSEDIYRGYTSESTTYECRVPSTILCDQSTSLSDRAASVKDWKKAEHKTIKTKYLKGRITRTTTVNEDFRCATNISENNHE